MSERLFKIDELEFDETIYPRARGEAWWGHVIRYADEMKNGSVFPPIVVGLYEDRKLVIDGWHRCMAYKKNGEEYVKAEIRKYNSEKEMYVDSVELNTTHGIMLTPFDKANIINKLEGYKISPLEISQIIKATPETFKRLQARTVTTPRGRFTLKSPLVKLLDRGFITSDEATGVDQSQIYIRSVTDLINHLITFIKSDTFPWHDPQLNVQLTLLYRALKENYAPMVEVK